MRQYFLLQVFSPLLEFLQSLLLRWLMLKPAEWSKNKEMSHWKKNVLKMLDPMVDLQ